MHPALSVLDADFAADREVVAWLVGAGLLAEPMPAPRGLAAEARDLRDAIGACVGAVAERRPVEEAALTRVDDWLVLAGTRPALRLDGDGRPVLTQRATDSPRRALGMLALAAAELLGTPEQRERLKVCAGCGELFHDRSPAGARRWCSMRTCGNRAKARRHRERAA